MGGDPLRSLRLAFVDDLEIPRLAAEDVSHFRRVLRMRAGEQLVVGDGKGGWRIVELGPSDTALVPRSDRVLIDPPPWRLTVAFAPTKGDRPEWTVQKLTELGVDRIIPLQTERSVVRWSANRAQKHHARWLRVVREAAMQSRQLYLPEIRPLSTLTEVTAIHPEAVICEPGSRPLGHQDRFVLIGPEGGFTSSELSGADAVGLPTTGILRAETAAIAAATLMSAFRYQEPTKPC